MSVRVVVFGLCLACAVVAAALLVTSDGGETRDSRSQTSDAVLPTPIVIDDELGTAKPIETHRYVAPKPDAEGVVKLKKGSLKHLSIRQRRLLRLASRVMGGELPYGLLEQPLEPEMMTLIERELESAAKRQIVRQANHHRSATGHAEELYKNGKWTVFDASGEVTVKDPADPTKTYTRSPSPYDTAVANEVIHEQAVRLPDGSLEMRVVRIRPDNDAKYAEMVLDYRAKRDEHRREVRQTVRGFFK